MKNYLVFFLLFLIIFFSCITSPDNDDENFSFKIFVKDPIGNPVGNLDVFLINNFNNPILEDFTEELRGWTSISFRLESDIFTDLNILDINSSNIRNLVNEELAGGYWCSTWEGKNDEEISVISGAYYCELNTFANDTLNYHEKKLMYLLAFDSEHRNGVTDNEGVFVSVDRRPFINLYDLDSLKIVDHLQTFLGYEVFSDTTIICLRDQNFDNLYQFEYVIIEDGKNEFELVWEPDTLNYVSRKTPDEIYYELERLDPPTPPDTTVLYGNYPNPFN